MALDTANKRLSAMNWGAPSGSLPLPDGTIDVGDRMALLGLYSGNPPPETSHYTPIWSAVAPITITHYEAMSEVLVKNYCDAWAPAVPHVYTLASGELPNGVTLAANGTLSGTPTNRATFTVSVRIVDAMAAEATSDPFTITVEPNPANVAASRYPLGGRRWRRW